MLPYAHVTLWKDLCEYPNNIKSEIEKQDPDSYYVENGLSEYCLYSPYERQFVRYNINLDSPVSKFYQTETSKCLLPRYIQDRVIDGFKDSIEYKLLRNMTTDVVYVKSHKDLPEISKKSELFQICSRENPNGWEKVFTIKDDTKHFGTARLSTDVMLDLSKNGLDRLTVRSLKNGCIAIGRYLARCILYQVFDYLVQFADSTNRISDTLGGVFSKLTYAPNSFIHDELHYPESILKLDEVFMPNPYFNGLLFTKNSLFTLYLTEDPYVDVDSNLNQNNCNLIIDIGSCIELNGSANLAVLKYTDSSSTY